MEGYFFGVDGKKIRDTQWPSNWVAQPMSGFVSFNHRPLSLSQRWRAGAGDWSRLKRPASPDQTCLASLIKSKKGQVLCIYEMHSP